MTKEDILIESLPYIQRYEGKTFVIKYGGAAMTDDLLKESFAKDVTMLRKIGINIIVVHGGGREITELSDQLGIDTHFVGGQRYTDKKVLKSVVMSLSGSTNTDLVALINRFGGNAVGLCGVDNSLIRAKQHKPKGLDLGLVGEVESVNVDFINTLLASGAMPVIAPLGVGVGGEIYNINADLAAGAIAGALGAEKLFYLSDTEGILNEGQLVPTLTNTRAQQLINQGVISGGMIPKVNSAFEALNNGVRKVHIINGSTRHSLLLEIFTNEGVGTQIIREEKVFAKSWQVSQNASEHPKSSEKQDFLDLMNLTKQDLEDLFQLSDGIKANPEFKPLRGKSVSIIFQKPSLRTRVSFEVGISQLGGTPVVLSNEGVGIGTRESAHDVAKVLASYSECIVARLFDHAVLEELAKNASVPVVNALTDLSHPCQVLADLYTIRQFGKLEPGMKVAFIGDGNNVANSWLEAAAIYPMHFVLATPKGFEPDKAILQRAIDAGISRIEIMQDPRIAADDADVLYTDVWTSMGQEEEGEKRRKAFKPYQINTDLVKLAHKDALVMHCLPAHRGEEITDDVMLGARSVIFAQAENRLHVQKALLTKLLSNEEPLSAAHTIGAPRTKHEQAIETVHH
jgi:ornithine carbamoyltransferase